MVEDNTEDDVNKDRVPDIMLLKWKRITSHTTTLDPKDITVMLTRVRMIMSNKTSPPLMKVSISIIGPS